MPKKESTHDTSKVIAKKMTIGEIRAWLRDAKTNLDPERVLEKTGEIIEKGFSISAKTSREENMTMHEAMMALGHERHYLLAESVVDERWRPMVMDLAQCIQKEYSCTTNSEIALAGIVAGAYYRSLRAARKMNALLEKEEIGMTGVNLMATVSKEIDRAQRQYLSAIETLRARRQPQMNVKVQTKAAFFGENQTFKTERQEPYETIDPQ